jgi:hypothetical protein
MLLPAQIETHFIEDIPASVHRIHTLGNFTMTARYWIISANAQINRNLLIVE